MKKNQSLVSIGGFLLALVLMSSSLLQAQGLSLGENPSSNEPSTGLVGSDSAPAIDFAAEEIDSSAWAASISPYASDRQREVTRVKNMVVSELQSNWRDSLNECVQEQIYSLTNSCASSFSLSFPFLGLSHGVRRLATAFNTDPYPLCSEQGIGGDDIDRRCACIAQQTNPENQYFRCGRFQFDYLRTTHYDDVTPEKAGEICQEIVNRSIIESTSKNLARYMDTAVVGELLGAATGRAMTCTAESIRSRFGDKFGRGEAAQGQRECSAQSLGFIMGQIEKTTRSCRDGGGVYKATCPLPQRLVPMDPVGSDAREAELEALLNATRGLSALPADATGPDEDRIKLRQDYEKFINESQLAGNYSKTVTDAAFGELLMVYQGAEVTAENYKEFLAAQTDKKKKTVIAIATYLNKQIGTNPDAETMLKGMNLADLPDIKEIMSGRADITDEDADKILNSLTGFVQDSCTDSASAMVSECKMLTTGLLHNSQHRKDYACGEGKDSQSSEIMLGALDSNNWDLLVRSKSDPSERAAIEQAMCFQHYTNGGLKTRNNSKSACEQMGEDGLHANLDPKFKSVESLQREFFDVQAEDSPENNQRLSQVSQSFSSCNPFASASNPNVHNTLMDERAAYSTADVKAALADQKNDHEQRRETVIWGESGYSASGSRYGSADRELASADEGSLGGGSAQDEIKERVRQRLDSTVTEAKDEAANFYENSAEMFKNLADERAAKVAEPVAEIASASSDAPASQAQIDAAKEERDRYDNILAQLDEMRKKNEDLFRRLSEQGIKEVKNEQGETVKVTDAFAETNRKIEEQRRRAIEEKERIEQTIAQAERAAVERRNAVASSGSAGVSGVSANRPVATATPGEAVSSAQASRSPASVSSAGPVVGSSASSVSAGGSSSQYGPAPIIQGIYLSSSELEKAMPKLSLNGQSPDAVRQMIEAVSSQVRLPAQIVNGEVIAEYMLEKGPDGEINMIFIKDGKVVVAPANVVVNAQQGAAREVAQVEEEPVAAESVAPVDSGRKSFSWDFVEQILDSASE